MKKQIKFLIIFLSLIVMFGVSFHCVEAQGLKNVLDDIGTGMYGEGATIQSAPFLVGAYIRAFLSMIGMGLVVIIVYAGYLWLTAGGNSENVIKARKWVSNGIIGLVITLSAFAITDFVMQRLATAYSEAQKTISNQK